jgi:hypothetical protein
LPVDIYASFLRPHATADPAPTTATTSKEK